MRPNGRKRAAVGWLLLGPLAAAAQQPLGPPEPEPDAEQAPRYRVELIVFAHEERDPGEEYLDVPPRQSRFNPKHDVPARRYVDAEMLRAIARQADGPITGERAADFQPFRDDVLAIDLFQPEPASLSLRILDANELALVGERATLERLPAYTPLFHGGWEQDGLDEERAVAIDLSLLGSSNPIGTIRLHVSRFLHARVDLAYRPPLIFSIPSPQLPGGSADPFGSTEPFESQPATESVYYLYEERRVFRNEINYLDHPAFGVILLVTLAPEPAPGPPAPGLGPSA